MINILSQSFPDLKGIFLGKGYLEKFVIKQIARLNLDKYVDLQGFQTDTYKFFRRAKILIMPSKSEGLASSMLEAMACGCVPIVSDVGNMTEAAHNGINSFVVSDYGNIDDFCLKIRLLLDNEDRRKRMSLEGIKLINKKYSLTPQTVIARNILKFGGV